MHSAVSANYRAVRCLSLTTLNNQRGSILLQRYMQNKTGNCLSLVKYKNENKFKEKLLTSTLDPEESHIPITGKFHALKHVITLTHFATSLYSSTKGTCLEDFAETSFWCLCRDILWFCTRILLVLAPQEVSRKEYIFPTWPSWQRSTKPLHQRIHLGVKASNLSHSDM